MSNSDPFSRYLAERPFFFAPLRSVESKLMAAAGATSAPALDLGCGDGFFGSLLPNTPFAAGLDPDLESLLASTCPGAHRIRVAAEAGRMPFGSESFATVMANSVLEHIDDLEPAMSEIHRVLRPGGRLLITTPSHRFAPMLLGTSLFRRFGLSAFSDSYGKWFNRRSRHFHTDSAEVWLSRLNTHGFSARRWHYYFSEDALHAFDLAHYASLDRLISFRLTGKWVSFRMLPFERVFDRWLRPHAVTTPVRDGAYLFLEAVKK